MITRLFASTNGMDKDDHSYYRRKMLSGVEACFSPLKIKSENLLLQSFSISDFSRFPWEASFYLFMGSIVRFRRRVYNVLDFIS